ncbi:MAG: PKD domain-containing protein [Bacteroidia bacterium]|nr:PKD domain-containing protein [Bacteroidia bacterium]
MRFLPFFLLLFACLNSQPQSIANYSNTRSTGTGYSSIFSTAFAFPAWRNTATYSQDDNRSYPVEIGFDFWYNGTRYTQLCVSTNGFIDFSSSTANGTGTGAYGYINSAFTGNGSGTWNSIAPVYDDLTAQGGTDPLGNSIRYLLSGTAPNRVFTIEWVNMAVYLNTSPSLNFQLKLYETSGIIEMNYGTMTPGSANWSYTCGINAATLSNTPNVNQLKSQQSPNSNTFTNGESNNLTPLPVSNSRITFTPPVPAPPSGALSFSSVTSSGMTLNWTNWAVNEVGYAIYKSTNGTDYFFVQQTAANATSAAVSGLLSSTTYYWKVMAVTEGAVSNALSGTQATISGGIKISAQTGNWQQGTTWSPPGIPQPGDDVIINNGHTVTVNQSVDCNSLTVGQGTSGTLQIGNNNTVRVMEVNGNLTVNSGASLIINSASNTTHRMLLQGNLTNNGTIDLNRDANSKCDLHLIGTGTLTFSGSGTVNDYNRIIVNMGTSMANIMEMTCSSFSAINGFLSLKNGTLKVSIPSSVTMVPWANGGTDTVYTNGKFWMNSSTVTANALNTLGLLGAIRISNGMLNIGDGANENLMVVGGSVQIENGNVNVAGRYFTSGINNIANFNMSGGTLTLPSVSSTSNIDAPFQITGVGSNFQMSGGTILIPREGGTGSANLGFVNTGSSGGSVTGGTLQIGNSTTPLSQTIYINSSFPVGNLLVNSANASAVLITNALTVIQNVNIAAGILNANSRNISLGGNWSDAGTFTPGTDTVFFNGTSGTQLIINASGETFDQLQFSGGALKVLNCAVSTGRDLIIGSGCTLDVSASNHSLFVKGSWINNGTFMARGGTVEMNGTTASILGGSTQTTFRNLTISNGAGAALSQSQKLEGTLLLNNGTFTTTGFNFTLLSTAARTARIGTITGGDIVGNIIMQRYVPNAPNDWRFIASAVTGTHTLAEWSDDFIMAGFPGSQYPNDPVPSVWTYDETVPGHKDSGFVAATNITNPVVNGKGYWVYMGPTPLTVDITGPPGKFNHSFPLTFTLTDINDYDGWNHIANPYPSSIDWDSPNWSLTNVDNEISIWNPNTQTYAQYSGGVPINGGSNIIPSSQGFWVHANAANPQLIVSENCKSATDTDFIKISSQQFTTTYNNILRLTLSGNNYYDETAIRFTPSATDTFDASYDAHKFWSLSYDVPQLCTNRGGLEYGINALPVPTQQISLPLGTYIGWGYSGTYTLRRDSTWNLPNSMCVILEDLLTGTMTDLRSTIGYTTTMYDTMTVPRFILHIGPPIRKERIHVNCPGGTNGMAVAEGLGSGPWDYTWKDGNNIVLRQVNAISGPDTLQNIGAGIYTVEINGNSGICGFLSDTIQVEGPLAMNILSQVTHESCSGTGDGSIQILQTLGGTAPYTFLWSNAQSSQSIQNLAAGNYTLTVTDANGCTQSFSFTLNSNGTVASVFSIASDTLILGNAQAVFSNYSSGFSSFIWDFGDGYQNTVQLNPVHTYTQAGVYTVSLTVNTVLCSSSSTATVIVLPANIGTGEIGASGFIIKSIDAGMWEIILPQGLEVNACMITDVLGRTLSANQLEWVGVKIKADLRNSAAGLYFIRLLTPDGERTIPIVRE